MRGRLFLFGEHIQAGIADLAGEAATLAIVIAGVSALSHSHLIVGEHGTAPGPPAPARQGRRSLCRGTNARRRA